MYKTKPIASMTIAPMAATAVAGDFSFKTLDCVMKIINTVTIGIAPALIKNCNMPMNGVPSMKYNMPIEKNDRASESAAFKSLLELTA